MTLRNMCALAGGLLLAAAPGVLAQPAGDQKPPELPKPAPEMAALDYFVGDWACEGTMEPGPFGPGGKSTSTAKIRDDLGGFWQAGTIKANMPNMPTFEGRFYTTYDTEAKEYAMLWVDSMGASSRSTSKGWQGDSIVYEGEMQMGAEKMLGRDTFTKAGDVMKHAMDAQVEGKWVSMGVETCRRSKP